MQIGAILAESWDLYRRFFSRFVLVALPVFLVLGLVQALAEASTDEAVGAALWGLAGLVVGLVGTFWVQGALVEAVRDVRDGSVDVSVGDLYASVRPRLAGLIVAGLLAGLGIAVGLVLLVVPGLYLLTRWSLIVPSIVLEGRSAGASFGRSAELVRGSGWRMFGLILVTAILVGIASGLLSALLAFLPDFLSTWLGGVIANSITIPFGSIAWTLAYYRLGGSGRERAAGPAPIVPA